MTAVNTKLWDEVWNGKRNLRWNHRGMLQVSRLPGDGRLWNSRRQRISGAPSSSSNGLFLEFFLIQAEAFHLVVEAAWIQTGKLCGPVDASLALGKHHPQI